MENLSNETKQPDFSADSSFDYKELLIHVLMRWPWVLLCLVLALTGAYFYTKTLTPKFKVTSSVLIKNDDKSSMHNLQDIGFVSTSTQNFDNELEILRSRTLIRKVVTSLDLYITHKAPGKFRDIELYHNSPIQVWVTPEEAEKIGYAEIVMKRNGIKTDVSITSGTQTYTHHFDSLPAVLPTEIGVFSFSVPKDTTATIAHELTEIHATIKSPTTVAAAYRNALTVAPKGKTSIAEVSVVTTVTQLGTDFINCLVQNYNTDANNDKNEVATKSAEFIDDRIRIINTELGSTESEIAEFKQKAGVVDVTTDASIAVSARSELEKAFDENETQIRLLSYIKGFLSDKTQRNEVIPANIGLEQSELNTLIGRYNEMMLERKRLLRTSSEDNPAVINLEGGIQLIRENIKVALNTAESALKIKRTDLQRQSQKYEGKVSQAPIKEKELLNITRQQEIKANLYLMLLQKREENNITLASTANNARIIDTPLLSGSVGPQNSQFYMIAVVIGLALPIGIIYLLSLMRFKIETRGDIEKITKLPVIGDIPLCKEAESKSAIVIRENRNEMMEEVFRSVRTNIQYMLSENQKVVLFTSTTPHEGKSFNAGNLAASLAFMGKRTVIVGLDIRKPGLNRVFNISRKEAGITQYLSSPGTTDLLSLCQPSELSGNLFILPGGVVPPNPTELVARRALDDAIEILKKEFDYIILDTAPIGMVTDTQLIARVADLAVYVCRSGFTSKSDFKLINDLVAERKLGHTCILLNSIDMDKRNTGYYYGYGKYGRYSSRHYGYGYGYGYGKENQ